MVAVFWTRPGQAPHLKPPSSLSAGEVPGCAAGWWVPSEGDGVRVCAPYEHVSVGEPSLVASTVARGALT